MRITTSSTGAKLALAACAALAAGGIVAGAALGVSVYQNDFTTVEEYDQIVRSGGSKECERRYRSKQKTMLVSVKRGPLTCAYRAPVEGDSELPNHALGVDAKILEDTPKSVRGAAFIELSVRAGGGGTGYTLRVFPEKGRFELVRGPAGGGDFPEKGKSDAIKGVGTRNRLSLVAKGSTVTALANKKELVAVTDSDPAPVTGRKVRFAIGSTRESGKDVIAVVKSVGVGVPAR